MNGVSIRAVVLATLAVMGIDIMSGIMLASIFGGPQMENAVTDEQIRAAALAMLENRAYLGWALVLGTASTVLGGYLAARLARIVPYFNALAFGAVGVVLGAMTSGDLPTWFRVFGLSLTIPAALVGAYLWKRSLTRAGS